jgi:hypothetical protein
VNLIMSPLINCRGEKRIFKGLNFHRCEHHKRFPRPAYKETCKKHDKKPGRKLPKDSACFQSEFGECAGSLGVFLTSFSSKNLIIHSL